MCEKFYKAISKKNTVILWILFVVLIVSGIFLSIVSFIMFDNGQQSYSYPVVALALVFLALSVLIVKAVTSLNKIIYRISDKVLLITKNRIQEEIALSNIISVEPHREISKVIIRKKDDSVKVLSIDETTRNNFLADLQNNDFKII